MMTMIMMTLSAFANDDFLNDLEASIAQEQAEDAQQETEQKTQAVTPPAVPSFEDELSFDLPAEAIKVDVSIELPDADVDVDINAGETVLLEPSYPLVLDTTGDALHVGTGNVTGIAATHVNFLITGDKEA